MLMSKWHLIQNPKPIIASRNIQRASTYLIQKLKGKSLRDTVESRDSRGGVLAQKKWVGGRGVRPASQNPYPIYDQNLRFSLPYL